MASEQAMHVTVRMRVDISPDLLRESNDFMQECRALLARPWYRRSPRRLAELLSRACDWLNEMARNATAECR
jgi:hypothetical protein